MNFRTSVISSIKFKYNFFVDVQEMSYGRYYVCGDNFEFTIYEEDLGPARIIDFLEIFDKKMRTEYPEELL